MMNGRRRRRISINGVGPNMSGVSINRLNGADWAISCPIARRHLPAARPVDRCGATLPAPRPDLWARRRRRNLHGRCVPRLEMIYRLIGPR